MVAEGAGIAPAPGSRPYANPYLAGVALGFVLLAAFVLVGRGLGASGAFGSVAAAAVGAVSPGAVASRPALARFAARGAPARTWLVWELAGVLLGGALSARAAGRWRLVVERGPRLALRPRLGFAFLGGGAMGLGAVLARGCTSGLGLTGGALLAAGSWLFLGAAFAVALGLAPAARKLWR